MLIPNKILIFRALSNTINLLAYEQETAFYLEYVPAVVRCEQDGYVSIYYSSYADEYFKDDRLVIQNLGDIVDKRIGVTLKDLKTYKILFNSKVYLSASVTNVIKSYSDYRDGCDWEWGFSYEELMYNKAYLKDIRIRE